MSGQSSVKPSIYTNLESTTWRSVSLRRHREDLIPTLWNRNTPGLKTFKDSETFFSRGCPAHPDGGDVATAAVSGQRRADHPALLAALPLHQHVAVQQAGDGHRVRAVLPLLGGHPPSAAQPHRGLGREAGPGARCWLPPQSNCTGRGTGNACRFSLGFVGIFYQ